MARQRLDNKGFVILLSVLVIGAAAVSATLYLIASGIGSVQNNLLLAEAAKARALTDACAETAISRVQSCSTLTGSFELSLDNAGCSYEILAPTEQEKIIQAAATVGKASRKVKINLSQVNSTTVMSAWQEVASF